MGKWHYAMSAQPILAPILCYSLKSHIVFTGDGFSPWPDKAAMHTHRRSKGKRWFNEEWRDLFLAFLAALKSGDGNIQIDLTDKVIFSMNARPVCLGADFGYIEPAKERQDVLDPSDESDSSEDKDDE